MKVVVVRAKSIRAHSSGPLKGSNLPYTRLGPFDCNNIADLVKETIDQCTAKLQYREEDIEGKS